MAFSKIRVVCVSDTHNAAPGEGFTLPKGDVLIHAGDLTNQGTHHELKKAIDWIARADHPVKIVIAGNHDISLDPEYSTKYESGWNVQPDDLHECTRLVSSRPDVIFFNHNAANVAIPYKNVTLRIFGSPYSPDRGKQNWAFQYDEGKASIWENVPDGLDILITHTPPKGLRDTSSYWKDGGCAKLKAAIARTRPRLHVCGHCHEGRGAVTIDWDRDEVISVWEDPGQGNKKQSLLDLTATTVRSECSVSPRCSASTIVNASITATSYDRGPKRFNKPIVVDLLVPVSGDATGRPRTSESSRSHRP